jgi:hypothetical protein
MPGRTEDDKDRALSAYYRANPDKFKAGVAGATRWIVCHELGHGIGTKDHNIGSGSAKCFMRNSSALCSQWQASDPFGAAFAWPTIYCRDAGHLNACFRSIQVTDYREPKR